jgi:hypothetical protein
MNLRWYWGRLTLINLIYWLINPVTVQRELDLFQHKNIQS